MRRRTGKLEEMFINLLQEYKRIIRRHALYVDLYAHIYAVYIHTQYTYTYISNVTQFLELPLSFTGVSAIIVVLTTFRYIQHI